MIPRPLLHLIRLNLRARLRKMARSFRGVKGVILLLVLLGFVAIFVTSQFKVQVGPSQATAPPLTGALALFAFTMMSALGGIKTRGVYFPPSELEFLFTAPFRRRELVAYRLLNQLAVVPILAAFFALFLMRHSSSYVTAWVGSVLVFALVSIVQFAISLAASSLSERIARLGGRVAFAGGIAALVLFVALIQYSVRGSSLDLYGMLAGFTESTGGKIVLAPFAVFTQVFSARRMWPDMAQATAGALGILGGLVTLVFLLDIDYREAAIETSRRAQERLRAFRRSGHAPPAMKRLRVRLPPLPRWGGVGPVAWRQLIEAARNAPAVLFFLAIFVVIFLSLSSRGHQALVMMVAILLVAPQRLTFDFRGDAEHMEILKTFPVTHLAMVLGQVLVPAVILTAFVEVGFAVLAFSGPESLRQASCAGLVLTPVLAILVIVLENTLFLLYPAGSRVMPGDVGALARGMVTIVIKMLCLAVAGGLAFLAGYLAYLATGESLVAAVGAAWIVCALAAFCSLLCCARAFRLYDVSRETVEH